VVGITLVIPVQRNLLVHKKGRAPGAGGDHPRGGRDDLGDGVLKAPGSLRRVGFQ